MGIRRENYINKYDLSGDYGIGYTSKGEEFYFDLEDYEKIKSYNWYIDSKGYVMKSNPSKRMHRLIMGNPDRNISIDHIYHNKRDNRKSRLRIVSNSQNQMNRSTPSQNTSGHRGISFHKNKQKWISQIGLNGKLIYLGIFDDINDAIHVRRQAEKKYFGEYNLKVE